MEDRQQIIETAHLMADAARRAILPLFRTGILAENKRLALLPEIAALYEELKSQLQNTVDVVVTSAFELSDAQADKLATALKAKLQCDVRVTSEIDESLIGGAIIRAGDLVIDGTVTGKLSKLAEAMKS